MKSFFMNSVSGGAIGIALALAFLSTQATGGPPVQAPPCSVLADGGNCGSNTRTYRGCVACCDAYCTGSGLSQCLQLCEGKD